MMRAFEGNLSKDILRLFSSDIGVNDFFSYVGNMVTIEQALAVIGVLCPDFIEREEYIFWKPNILEYSPEASPLVGFERKITGNLIQSNKRKDIERYNNNFSVSQFFSKWEGSPDKEIIQVELPEKDYYLCHHFAQQLTYYWKTALLEKFPNKVFEFEIADNILDEYGVCLTFWQSEDDL